MQEQDEKAEFILPFAFLSADTHTAVPLFKQIFDELRTAILTEDSKRELAYLRRKLASDLGVSRNTVMGAYEQLLAEGYVEGIGGSGTFVAGMLPEDVAIRRDSPGPPAITGGADCFRNAVLSWRQFFLKLREVFGHSRPFRSSTPDPVSFPFDIWTRFLARYSRNPSADLLGYAYPAGYPRLREVIAAYLKSARGVRCEAAQIIIVAGAQSSFDIVTQMLLDPGETALIEDPGYFGVRGVLGRAGVRFAPISIDEEGISISAIREDRSGARLLFVTPSHQYPLGVTMTLARRLEVLEWAQQAEAWIVEDDYDGEFRYKGQNRFHHCGWICSQRVIYTGTFSKVMFPSLRIGYLVAPHDLVEAFTKARVFGDLCGNTIPQAALADFIEEGHFTRHLRRMRKLYADRQACLVSTAKTELSGFLEIQERAAGMHLIGWLPHGVSDQAAARAAWRHKIIAGPLSGFGIKPVQRGALVLGFTAFNERKIRDGIKELRVALSEIAG
jgi:GntR family transcriptional regulator/MocR family aminotransferase